MKELGEILQEVNALDQDWHIEDNVNKIEDTLTDSQVLSTASAILVKCIKAVQTADSTYEATEFAEKIRNSIGNREEEINQKTDWFKLLEDARHIVLEIPQYAFTYGTFDITKVPEPKVKKQKTRDAPEQLVKKRLENIVSVEKEEAGINEIVAFLQKVLQSEYIKNNRQPINYYKYVIDTSSFATTVENMFYCSFLIRNGTAAMAVGMLLYFFYMINIVVLHVDESGQPSIKPVSKNRLTTFREEGGKNIQMIASISMEEWEVFTLQR